MPVLIESLYMICYLMLLETVALSVTILKVFEIGMTSSFILGQDQMKICESKSPWMVCIYYNSIVCSIFHRFRNCCSQNVP